MRKEKNTLFVLFCFVAFFASAVQVQAQDNIRASQKASVTQYVGNDNIITITYSRPSVKGRTIWGELVPYGMQEGNNYSDNKPFPWRAGANENTTIELSSDATIEGKSLPAGTYSIHMIPAEDDDWVVIFNKAYEGWGSYKYDESKDAARVEVEPTSAPANELLTFGFDSVTNNSTTAYLHWDELKVPFTISFE